MKNWTEIASFSELSAVQELKKSFDEGNLVDVEEGLIQLIDVMAKAEQRALLSHITNLMMHILKWQIQPEKHSRSWLKTIFKSELERNNLHLHFRLLLLKNQKNLIKF